MTIVTPSSCAAIISALIGGIVAFIAAVISLLLGAGVWMTALGCVDKKDSPARSAVIQAHLYMGDELGTQPDVRRRMGIL